MSNSNWRLLLSLVLMCCLLLYCGCAAKQAEAENGNHIASGETAAAAEPVQQCELHVFCSAPGETYSVSDEDWALLQGLFHHDRMEETPMPSENPCLYQFVSGEYSYSLSDMLDFVDVVHNDHGTYDYYAIKLTDDESETLARILQTYTSEAA